MKFRFYGSLFLFALICSGGLYFSSSSVQAVSIIQEDDCIPPDIIDESEVEAIVAQEMGLIEQTYVRIDEIESVIHAVEPTPEPIFNDDSGSLIITLEEGLLFLGLDLEEITFTGDAVLLYGESNPESGDFEVEEQFFGELDVVQERCNFHLTGELIGLDDESSTLDIVMNPARVSAGSSQVEIEGTSAYLTGDLGTVTYKQIADLIEKFPEVDTLVLVDVPGSINDSINMHTGRLVRDAGLTTYVPADGVIASGGVDLFMAGVERIVEEGAMLGVHSWCCFFDEEETDEVGASELPEDHEAHAAQIAYFTEMMGEDGRDFYFYTLEAANFEDIHYMTQDEILSWDVAEIVGSTSD